ncbi:thiolase family protein [uncultured Helcococcus sp.]|uniref:thiolase family protein n=1 Tax=uncultured Helcococcus sp. TaxID=1072508 RepID=UPI00288A17A2|nr:thiolase family protein [uncultured Helcococcus sp.]
MKSIVFVGAARSAVGKYLGKLKNISIEKLGEIVLEEAISRAKIKKNDIDEVVVGNVISSNTAVNLAQVIGINMGLKDELTGMTVNRVCGSGIQAAISAFHELQLSKKEVVAAGGIEMMSRSPYQLPLEARFQGLGLANKALIDTNFECLRSVSGTDHVIENMGLIAENIVEKYKISREDQDKFAYDSHIKAQKAKESGRLGQEIVGIEVENGFIFDEDEQVRPDTSIEKLAKLRPAFRKEGSVTGGNSSSFNDGAAFTIMTTEDYAKENNLDIMAKFVDYSIIGLRPDMMGMGPVEAINKICRDNNLDLKKDIDILEINEAFAGQVLGCLEELDISMDSEYYKNSFNINGGAIALGHPLAMSGARQITSIIYEFKNNPNKRYAIASACIGGGQGIAILLENPAYKG